MMLVLFLASVFVVAFRIQLVRADLASRVYVAPSSQRERAVTVAPTQAIYIRADGSISPSAAQVYSGDNVTYALTGNITDVADGIMVERDNITLDGAGYALTGSGNGNGTVLTNVSNVTETNIMITNFTNGVELDYSSNNVLSEDNVANNGNGIELTYSSGNAVFDNNVSSNGDGIDIGSSSNSTLSGNTVTGNSQYGIHLDSSTGDTLTGNNVTNNDVGILLGSSSGNTLSGNYVGNNGHGIEVSYSSGDTLTGNNVTDNLMGIVFGTSSYNVLSGNNVASNNVYGIYLYSSFSNSIFHNSIVTNAGAVFSEISNNTWDDGFPSGGNYWSDYQAKYPNATETDGSGIWNTPYVIDANNTDHYPLMVQYAIPEFPSFLILPLFFMTTLFLAILCKKRKT